MVKPEVSPKHSVSSPLRTKIQVDVFLRSDRDQYEGTTVCPPVKTRRVTLAQQPMGSTHEVPCDNANGGKFAVVVKAEMRGVI